MSAVALELAKAHMKIDGNAEDELISRYIDAAETWCGNYIDKPIADFTPVLPTCVRARSGWRRGVSTCSLMRFPGTYLLPVAFPLIQQGG